MKLTVLCFTLLGYVAAQGAEQQQHRELEQCQETNLVCWATKLDAQVAELEGINERLRNSDMSKFSDFVSKFNSVWAKVNNVDSLVDTIRPVMELASKLPYGVGAAISPLLAGIKVIDGPMDQLETKINDAKTRLVDPWHHTLGQVNDALDSMLQGAGTLSVLGIQAGEMWEEDCFRKMLVGITPHLTPAISTLTQTTKQVVDAIEIVLSKLRAVVAAFSSSTWQSLMNGVNRANTMMGQLASKVNMFEPISSLMQEPISIPWIPVVRAKKTIGIQCPSGYDKTGLLCYETCSRGYYGVEFLCWSSCPSGYRDLGASCSNKEYYIRSIRPAKPTWGGMKCSSGWERKRGVACWQNCRSGYQSIDLGVMGACYKGCPGGMSMDPTKKICWKKTYSRKSTRAICPSGYTYTGVSCLENCRSDETDTGLFCNKGTKKSFTIAKIAEDIKKVLDPIMNLPFIKEVEKLLADMMKLILAPILNAIGIGLDDLPSFPFNQLEGLLPLDNLIAAIQQVNSLQFSALQSITDVSNLLGNMRAKFKPNIDLSCTTFECVLAALQAPPELKRLLEAFTNLDILELVGKYVDMFSGFEGCAEYEELTIPPSILEHVGISSMTEDCIPKVTVCKRLEFNTSVVTDAMDDLIQFTSGLVEEGTNDRRILVNAGNSTDQDEQPVKTWSLPAIPISTFDLFRIQGQVSWKGLGGTTKHFLGGGGPDGIMASNHLEIRPDISLAPKLLVFPGGRKQVSLRFNVLFEFEFRRSAGKVPELVRLMQGRLDELIETAEYVAEELDFQFQWQDVDGPRCLCSDRSTLHTRCEALCDGIDKVRNPDEWGTWSPGEIMSIPDFVDQYPDDNHPYWKTRKGMKMGSRMLTHMARLESELKGEFKTLAETIQGMLQKFRRLVGRTYTNGGNPNQEAPSAPSGLKRKMVIKVFLALLNKGIQRLGFTEGTYDSGFYAGWMVKLDSGRGGALVGTNFKYLGDTGSDFSVSYVNPSDRTDFFRPGIYPGAFFGWESPDILL